MQGRFETPEEFDRTLKRAIAKSVGATQWRPREVCHVRCGRKSRHGFLRACSAHLLTYGCKVGLRQPAVGGPPGKLPVFR